MNPKAIRDLPATNAAWNALTCRSALEVNSAHRGIIVLGPFDLVKIRQQLLERLLGARDVTRRTNQIDLPSVVALKNYNATRVRLRRRDGCERAVRLNTCLGPSFGGVDSQERSCAFA